MLEPTSESERIHALDAMRGVAILGVLVAYTVWSLGGPDEWSAADKWVARGMDLFVDNKFLTMFACLFGLGIAQQWRRWQAAGQDIVPLHGRRMGFLLAVGVVHAVLLRNGDILAPYAILGFVLLALRKLSNRALGILMTLCFVFPFAAGFAMKAVGWSFPPRPVAMSGNYLADNWTWLRYWYVTEPIRGWPTILARILGGFLLGRTGFFERLVAERSLTARVFGASLLLAVLLRVAFEWLGAHAPPRLIRGALYELGSWALAAAYGTGIILLLRDPVWVRRLRPLRAEGRMAFTNYLSQAFVLVPVCLIFGLFDTVTPLRGVLIALPLAVAQLAFSTWWLSRHRLGPLERVWRGFTYGGINPSRPPAEPKSARRA